MTYIGPLQVVPDIDQEKDKKESNNESSSTTTTPSTTLANSSPSPSSSSSILSPYPPHMTDLEKKLLHVQCDLVHESVKVRPLATRRQRRENQQMTVTRLNRDAQRLSAAELHWYRRLAELRTQHQ